MGLLRERKAVRRRNPAKHTAEARAASHIQKLNGQHISLSKEELQPGIEHYQAVLVGVAVEIAALFPGETSPRKSPAAHFQHRALVGNGPQSCRQHPESIGRRHAQQQPVKMPLDKIQHLLPLLPKGRAQNRHHANDRHVQKKGIPMEPGDLLYTADPGGEDHAAQPQKAQQHPLQWQ